MVVSILSVNIIAPLIMWLEFGFTKEVYLSAFQTMPFIWLSVILLVPLIVEPLASKFVSLFSDKHDGFNSKILFNVLFSVLILSIILTTIAPWIALREISIESFQTFFLRWPKNFFIAFWIELLIAQPIARFVMIKLHSSTKTVKAS
jgi:hypothetical protein